MAPPRHGRQPGPGPGVPPIPGANRPAGILARGRRSRAPAGLASA